MKSVFKKALEAIAPRSMKQPAQLHGWRVVLTYFFFQRVLRINGHVPWLAHWSSIVSFPERIELKSAFVYPGYMPGQYIQAMNGIVIGRNVLLGPGVKLVSANHDIYDFTNYEKAPPIEIGDNCWLGSNVVILPGVKLGNHVIVAAGAVVTKNFQGNCVIGGVPARILRELDDYTASESRRRYA